MKVYNFSVAFGSRLGNFDIEANNEEEACLIFCDILKAERSLVIRLDNTAKPSKKGASHEPSN